MTTDRKISLPLFIISGKAMDVNLCGPSDACIMAHLLFWRVFRRIRIVIKDITCGIIYPLHLISRLKIFITVWDVKVSTMGNYTRQAGINVAFLFKHLVDALEQDAREYAESISLACCAIFEKFIHRFSVVDEVRLILVNEITSYWSNCLKLKLKIFNSTISIIRYIQDEDWNPTGFICLLFMKNIH